MQSPIRLFRVDGLLHLLYYFCRVGRAKDGRSGHDDVAACLGTATDRVRSDASVDLDVFGREPLAQLLDFGHAFSHELLAAFARDDGHDEQHVYRVTELVRDCF